MKIPKENRIKHENSPECVAYEYPFEDKDINVAIIEVSGRYPSSGYVTNEQVKEMLFVTSGAGKVVIGFDEYELVKGDMVLINPGQEYCIDGNLELVISCSPAWYSEQHKNVDELSFSAASKLEKN